MSLSEAFYAIGAAVLFVLLVLWRRAWLRRRDARLAATWQSVVAQAEANGWYIAWISNVYQYAHRGSKAELHWLGQEGDWPQDTWFEDWHPPARVWVVLTGRIGYGPHNDNPSVLYVYPGDIHGTLPVKVTKAWNRHQRRLAARRRG